MKFLKVALLVAAIFGLATFFWQNLRQSKNRGWSVSSTAPQPHFYLHPEISLANIKLQVFYAVPKNLTASLDPNWKESLTAVLKEVQNFHQIQFHYTSQIQVSVYDQPIILQHESLFYDTKITSEGNPNALRTIVPELEDKYPQVTKASGPAYNVIAIIYEGVGAAGSPGALIISRTFLTSPEYKRQRASLLYHEFGHAIGLPDRYDLKTNIPSSNDIMGSGRNKEIKINYLGQDLLAGLGVGK